MGLDISKVGGSGREDSGRQGAGRARARVNRVEKSERKGGGMGIGLGGEDKKLMSA